MKKNVLISVMMPAYNAEKYIEESIQSVLSQNCNNFELVIYDDGSKDNTFNIVQRLSRKSDVIRLYRSKINRGVSYARNYILSKSAGYFIAPHDADDIMLPDRLKKHSNILVQHRDISVVFGSAIMMDESMSRILGFMGPYTSADGITKNFILKPKKLCKGRTRYSWGVPNGSVMYRKYLAQTVRGYDESLVSGEDLDFLFKLWMQKRKFYFTSGYHYIYRKRSDSLHHTANGKSNPTYYKLENGFLSVVLKHDNKKHIRWILHNLSKKWNIKKIHDLGESAKGSYCIDSKKRMSLEKCEEYLIGPKDSLVLRRKPKTCVVSRDNRSALMVRDNLDDLSPSAVFHGLFLYPLSRMLVADNHFIFHGSLCSKRGRGVLFSGTDGAGKSSLMLSLVERGYRYYSDECPILLLKNNKVSGEAFHNKISLHKNSLKNFSEIRPKFRHNRSFDKYYLNPTEIGSSKIWRGCPINLIIFPSYDEGVSEMQFVRMNDRSSYARLLMDDYCLLSRREGKALFKRYCFFMKNLSKQAISYRLTYNDHNIKCIDRLIGKVLKEI